MTALSDKRIAILAADGFEQSELMVPLARLRQVGARVDVISPEAGEIRGWDEKDWGESVPVDRTLGEVDEADYDALVLPGGQINPDVLRTKPDAVNFVKAFYKAKKPIAAICHAPWLLIEAGLARGLSATSYASIRTDMENAGAKWTDAPVVVDQGIITSRNPGDLDQFCGKIVDEVGKGGHDNRKVA